MSDPAPERQIGEGPPPPDTRRTVMLLTWLVVIVLVVPSVWMALRGGGEKSAPHAETAAGTGGDATPEHAGEGGGVAVADPATGLLRKSPGGLVELGCVESSGREMKTTDLLGKFVVADFIFTNCPGPCLRMTEAMHGLQEATAGSDDLLLASFTVDPKRDSPEKLASYAELHGADPSRWLFFFMPKAFVHKLAREGLKLGHPDDPLLHSQKFVLLDRQGRVRGYYEPLTDPKWQEKLLAGLDRLRAPVGE